MNKKKTKKISPAVPFPPNQLVGEAAKEVFNPDSYKSLSEQAVEAYKKSKEDIIKYFEGRGLKGISYNFNKNKYVLDGHEFELRGTSTDPFLVSYKNVWVVVDDLLSFGNFLSGLKPSLWKRIKNWFKK